MDKVRIVLSMFFLTLAFCLFPFSAAVNNFIRKIKPPSVEYMKRFSKEQLDNLFERDYVQKKES